MSGENDYDELVMSLLESALDRSPEERAPYLRSVCRGDPALYEEVWSRVEWEQRMGGFLREPLLSPECVSPRLEAGTRLSDRFRIVREVGSGGMGVNARSWASGTDCRRRPAMRARSAISTFARFTTCT